MKNLKTTLLIIVTIVGLLVIGCTDIVVEREIVAFQCGETIDGKINGSFFLFSGTIEEQPIYKYLWVQPDGGIRLDWIDATKTTIYETNEISPKIRIKTNEFSESEDWNWVWIPKNSVLQEFRIDLK